MGLVGGMQVGLWRMKSVYQQIDPRFEIAHEGRAIIVELRRRRMDTSTLNKDLQTNCPVQKSEKQSTVRTNKYGDIIDEK